MEIVEISEQQRFLWQKRAILENLVQKEKRMYFHLNSLNNFIYHFNEITNFEDREWVFKRIINYIDEALRLTHLINLDSSKTIYKTYLEKIAKYYENYLGFTMHVYLWIITIMYLIVFAIIAYFTTVYIGLITLEAVS
jgi:hypothetical protein